MQMFAMSQVLHSIRNTEERNGASGESSSSRIAAVRAALGWDSGMSSYDCRPLSSVPVLLLTPARTAKAKAMKACMERLQPALIGGDVSESQFVVLPWVFTIPKSLTSP
jgi:hypothetical protein